MGVPRLPTESADHAPPDAFGPYRVLHQIGAGTLGPVFRAYSPDQDRLVAIKQFRLDLPPQRVHQLVAELEQLIAKTPTHQGIAAPITAGMVGLTAFLAEDLVAGDSVDVIVRDSRSMLPAKVARVATELGAALDCAAARDIVHGALHPRDLLVSPDDTRLTGLGIARAVERVGFTPPVRRPYTAPERAAGARWDRRADIFSLAAIVYEMLWGRRVTATGERAASSLAKIAGTDSTALARVFAKALAEKPEQRFDTALAFAEALKEGLNEALAPPAELRLPLDAQPAPLADLELHATTGGPQPADLAAEGRIDGPPEGGHGHDRDLGDRDLGARGRDERGSSGRGSRDRGVEDPGPDDRHLVSLGAGDRTADELRSDDRRPGTASLESAPAVAPPVGRKVPMRSFQAEERPADLSTRVWPLILAVLVGLALGFAGGYGIGSRDRPVTQTTAGLADPPIVSEPPPRDPAAREALTRETPARVAPAREGPDREAPARDFTDAVATGKPPATQDRSVPEPPAPPAAPNRAASANTDSARTGAGAAAVGRLLVRSTPAGARVLIDGREVGVTPATVRELSAGTHQVRVARDGYAAVDRRVVVTTERLAQSITVELTPLRTTAKDGGTATPRPVPPAPPGNDRGGIFVDSRPSGARVFLDSKVIGVTPIAFDDVPAGEHAVRLEREGYRGWTTSVRVVAGERSRVTASLER